MTIGSLETARMLNTHFSDSWCRRSPNGFNKVGEGTYRMAVLEKDTNVVYKLGDYQSNISEAYNARRLRRKSTRNLGFVLHIPRTRTYRMPSTRYKRPYRDYDEVFQHCVVAQGYAGKGTKWTYCASQDDWMMNVPDCNCYNRSKICFTTVHQRVIEFSGLDDIHCGNILIDRNNEFWLIDLGC